MKLKHLLNPLFILSLFILLLNDFYLKETYHNWITGKLSDVFGLIVMALFLTFIFPKVKKHLFILTALLFVLWKLEFSQPVIDSWNSLKIMLIGRVVDCSDLFSILILIPVYRFKPKEYNFNLILKKIVGVVVIFITVFSITATSRVRHLYVYQVNPEKYIKVKSTKKEFFNRLENDNVKFNITDSSFIIKRDTLDYIVLENIILEKDTVPEISIGILDKGKFVKVYVKSIIIIDENKKGAYMVPPKDYAKFSGGYENSLEEFLTKTE